MCTRSYLWPVLTGDPTHSYPCLCPHTLNSHEAGTAPSVLFLPYHTGAHVNAVNGFALCAHSLCAGILLSWVMGTDECSRVSVCMRAFESSRRQNAITPSSPTNREEEEQEAFGRCRSHFMVIRSKRKKVLGVRGKKQGLSAAIRHVCRVYS